MEHWVSLLGIHSFIYRLEHDAETRGTFQHRDDAAFSGFDLTDDERTALKARDVATLHRLGVHPLFLAPEFTLSRFGTREVPGCPGSAEGSAATSQLGSRAMEKYRRFVSPSRRA
jgi:hypothetical protein